MTTDKQQAAREGVKKLYDDAGLGWLRYKTAKGKTIDCMTLQETAEYIIEMEAAQAAIMPVLVEASDKLQKTRCLACPTITASTDETIARLNAIIGENHD